MLRPQNERELICTGCAILAAAYMLLLLLSWP